MNNDHCCYDPNRNIITDFEELMNVLLEALFNEDSFYANYCSITWNKPKIYGVNK